MKPLRRHLSLQVGLLLCGASIAVTVQAHLGLAPWDVFHQGLSRRLPLSLGQASEVTGLVIIGAAWPLGQRPGLGTFCNMALIGFWLDRVLATGWLPDAATAPLGVRALMTLAAVAVFGLGSGLYIAPRLGAGPRDSLMLALAWRSRRPVALVRAAIEGSACLFGILLGGTAGPGTLAFALLVGPAVGVGLRLFGVDVRRRAASGDAVLEELTEPLAAGL